MKIEVQKATYSNTEASLSHLTLTHSNYTSIIWPLLLSVGFRNLVWLQLLDIFQLLRVFGAQRISALIMLLKLKKSCRTYFPFSKSFQMKCEEHGMKNFFTWTRSNQCSNCNLKRCFNSFGLFEKKS
ncbi:unnamed protein product [Schistosoma spindalis]|nr:unnamed protein product [Schistosoma spindale]